MHSHFTVADEKGDEYNRDLRTCPSAITTRTWYCPPLFSTMSIAASMIGANEVGPTEAGEGCYSQSLSFDNLTNRLLMHKELSISYSFTRLHCLLAA